MIAAWFFVGLAAIFAGLVVEFGYEAYALATGRTLTISQIGAFDYLTHPRWFVTIACAVAFVLGALVTHFTHWTP